MAGSSVPLAQRRQALDIREGNQIEEAVSIHGGGLESYDFHAFEVLESLAEFRKGGETGISNVEFLTGDALWKAADERRWSLPLAQAAMGAEFGKNAPDLRRPIPNEQPAPVHAILLTQHVLVGSSEVSQILFFAVLTNFVLFFFNLLPVPPLDGGHVAQSFMPYRHRDKFDNFARYSPFIVLGFMLIPQMQVVFVWPARFLTLHLYDLLGVLSL
jgi:hypothetical protein